jgi:hypothetical protein
MKHYIFNGKTYDTLPDPLHTEAGEVSPMTDERFVALGGTIEDDGQPTPFEAACAQFRAVCSDIGTFIGDLGFRGGFDEYSVFATSEAYQQNPVQGNALAIKWSAFNELCKYEGAKIGLGQPDWWYLCWEENAES